MEKKKIKNIERKIKIKNKVLCMIKDIADTFHFDNDDLRKVFRVREKTVINWRASFTIPRYKKMMRLKTILHVCEQIKSNEFFFDKIFLHKKITEDKKSIFDLLCAPEVNEHKILFFAHRLSQICR